MNDCDPELLYKLHGDNLHAHEHLAAEGKKFAYQYGGDSGSE